MKVLALTSSTTQASVALVAPGFQSELRHERPRGHAEFLNLAIQKLLKDSDFAAADLDLIAVDQGPGSFTGIRVAISVTRTLCYLLKKPCFVSTSAEILYRQTQIYFTEKNEAIYGINAFKNLIFFANFFEKNPTPKIEVLSPEQVEERVGVSKFSRLWLGDGLQTYRQFFSSQFLDSIIAPPSELIFPSATALALLASESTKERWTMDWKLIAPLYLRDSAAEENLRIRS